MTEMKNVEVKRLFLFGIITAILVSSFISTIITIQLRDTTLRGPKGDKGDTGPTGPAGPATVIAHWDVQWATLTLYMQWGFQVGTSQFASTFDYNWQNGKVFSTYSDYIGFNATMQVRMQRNGPVTITIGSEDGARLYIDGLLWIDNWNNVGTYTIKSVTIDPFVQGYHTLVLVYYKITGNARISFTCDSDILMWNP